MYRCNISGSPGALVDRNVMGRPTASTRIDLYGYPASETGNDVRGRQQRYDRLLAAGAPAFPTQYFGLKAYYQGAVRNLCLVAEADAPASMGGVLKVNKNGTLYGVYLVETTDPNASPCYIRTSTGTKAIREKT